jgi:hypothetical protein
MAFIWTSLNAGDPIKNEDMNEIHDNLDSIYSYLELSRGAEGSGANWPTAWPLRNRDPIRSAHLQELRNVTDYADDHWCSTHNASDNSLDKSNHYSLYNRNDHSAYDYSDDSYVRGSYNSSYVW